jgi:hypothetical protein
MFDGRYFVSIVALRFNPTTSRCDVHHLLATYDFFSSGDEALGRAMKWTEERWPQNEGWRHDFRILAHDAQNPAATDSAEPTSSDPSAAPSSASG